MLETLRRIRCLGRISISLGWIVINVLGYEGSKWGANYESKGNEEDLGRSFWYSSKAYR